VKIHSLLLSDSQCLLNENVQKLANSSFVPMQRELPQNLYLILFELQTNCFGIIYILKDAKLLIEEVPPTTSINSN